MFKKAVFGLLFLSMFVRADFIRDDAKEVVIDTSSGLMWQDNNDTNRDLLNWDEAIDYCENLTLGGYSDWHLANINQLFYLADRSRYNVALDPAFVSVGPWIYWSSTTTYDGNVTADDFAWYVDFKYGYMQAYDKNPPYDGFSAMCVRKIE